MAMVTATVAADFRVMDGKYGYTGGTPFEEVELRGSLDELVDMTVDLEREAQMKDKLVAMRIFGMQPDSNLVIEQFLNLESFKEANEFFNRAPLLLSASALINLTTFLEANLKLFGDDHPIDAVSLQTLFDIITSQKQLYIRIGLGGEGTVYRKESYQDPDSKAFIPVRPGSSSSARVKAHSPKDPSPSPETVGATSIAVKVLKGPDVEGGYDPSSPEIVVARDHSRSATPSPLLRGSCVTPVQIDKFDPISMALCMEMGDSSMAKFFSTENDVGKRLVKVLQMAEQVANLAAQGLVHRDLKPDNFMLTASGHMLMIDPSQIQKVGDKVDAMFSTIIYSSPRETTGVDGFEMTVTPGIDVWSLGIMLYEAISGEPPKLSKMPPKSIVLIAETDYIQLMLPDTPANQEWDSILGVIRGLGASLEEGLDKLRDVAMLEERGCAIKTVVEGASYFTERLKVVDILKKPLIELSLGDLKFIKDFLESNYTNLLVETCTTQIQSIIKSIHSIRGYINFSKYPELKGMCKKLIAVDPEDRGTAAQFVADLSEFLVNHPEFLS